MGALYKLDFPNGKAYIGITEKTAQKRFAQHASAVRLNGKTYLCQAWRKHGAPKMTVLAIIENYDLLETEARAIAAYGTMGEGGYNSTPGGDFSPSKIPSIAAKIRATLTGRKHSDAARKRMSESQTGQVKSAESKAKIGAAQLGRKHSPEHRAKVEATKALTRKPSVPLSEEHRKKISIARTGYKPSPEARAKMSLAQKRRYAK